MNHEPLLCLMLSFFVFPILVTCKPCSDEEVLIAVCTSDFGKYINTNEHTFLPEG